MTMTSSPVTRETKPQQRGVQYRRRSFLLLGAGLLTLGGGLLWRYSYPRPTELYSETIRLGEESFQIGVEAFHPEDATGDSPRPAIILLHGVEGPHRYKSARYAAADMLRDQGYSVFIIHYFDSTNYDDLYLITEENKLDVDAIERVRLTDYRRWVSTITQVIEAIARRPDIDPERIAINGYSLGGFTALAVAQECQVNDQLPNIRAVVVNWGAMWKETEFTAGFPPTQFVHGKRDQIIPVDWAHETIRLLRSVGTAADIYLVPAHLVPYPGHTARSEESDRITRAFLAHHFRYSQVGQTPIPTNSLASLPPW